MTTWDKTATTIVELEVKIRYTGHHEPAYTSGLPENCYPEDFDSELEILSIKYRDKELPVDLKGAFADQLSDILHTEAANGEIDFD